VQQLLLFQVIVQKLDSALLAVSSVFELLARSPDWHPAWFPSGPGRANLKAGLSLAIRDTNLTVSRWSPNRV